MLQVELALAPYIGARHLGLAKLEAVAKLDRATMRFPRHRITDGLDDTLQNALHVESPGGFVEIPLELDVGEDRLGLVRDGGGVDGKARGRLLLLSAQYREQRVDLLFGGALVDDAPPRAVAVVHRFGPVIGAGDAQSVQAHVAEIAFGDFYRHHALAGRVRRRRIELARATVVAAAAGDLLRSYHPIDVGHVYPPSWRWGQINALATILTLRLGRRQTGGDAPGGCSRATALLPRIGLDMERAPWCDHDNSSSEVMRWQKDSRTTSPRRTP
jgi:hypothetical protein